MNQIDRLDTRYGREIGILKDTGGMYVSQGDYYSASSALAGMARIQADLTNLHDASGVPCPEALGSLFRLVER